mmetsp:Transcript_26830/g.43187  ORF Transcript_26830/g.43187 Transcript_26830/m.43187 type:complete len:1228 (+) Transcript_26830:546-4229(+)|eukprot:CAMPEP_0203755982 /NCGR_PEP_ID=MMETSP0098-20131031/9303_1 /ASSEMBLY_ACC=CAM_ASM_000208 /TAXON_ID=96639 /ORGANISM=" , Strain NY0313808BC1" /LENGTH=1227 /DNA_ID=CAMNT_0050647633 /DNA_START=185 /DNA_END=3868 /DNA_ORIENTATION=-
MVVYDGLKKWISAAFRIAGHAGDEVEQDVTGGKRDDKSIRWVAILCGLVVFLYEFASPLIHSQKGVYIDIRVGLLVWLSAAALLHTPMGSSEIEDDPSLLFVSVFVLMLVVTHMALATFTVIHHVFAWLLGLVFPTLAETLWVPVLRSVRSFKTVLRASIALSASLSFLFAYCTTVPEKVGGGTTCSALDTLTLSKKCISGDLPLTISQAICTDLMPQLEDFWGHHTYEFFGVDVGRLSLLESPIGFLWISGIAIWATYYTLRRTRRINQTLERRAIRKGQQNSDNEKTTEDQDGEESEDEYDAEVTPADSRKRAKKSPTDLLPMTEWYSLALTETAFQLLISMKLFLGRFDMRTMQAAIRDKYENQGESASDTSFDGRYGDLHELWFDWLADTGDGGNPTYAIARTVAQPTLSLKNIKDPKGALLNLKRGNLLVLGGDLAYPTPTKEEYGRRLFVPFEYAMEPPPSYHRDDISSDTPGNGGSTLSSRLSFVPSSKVQNDGNSPSRFSQPYRAFSDEEGGGGNDEEFKLPKLIKSNTQLLSSSDVFQIGGSIDSLKSMTSEENEEDDAFLSCSTENENEKVTVWAGPPCCFAIPGNHDWFDGLDTFMQCICYRDWLGGWMLPQKKSYFALRLPHGWWLFALDLALEDDIDGLQYKYFAEIATNHVQEDDQIIVGTHEPTWLLDAYLNEPHPESQPYQKSAKNLKQLMRRHLRGRVALRIAGDVHNYIRHDAVQPLNQAALRAGASPVLVVSGGGGAFSHPTHTFPCKFKETGAHYERKCAYPSDNQSRKVSVQNLGGFRLQNWKFDIVGATMYFLTISSFFPRCKLDQILNVAVYPDGLSAFAIEVFTIFLEVWTHSAVSLFVVSAGFFASYCFADEHHGTWRRFLIATMHTVVHVFSAIVLFLLLEITVEIVIQDGLAGKGYNSMFESFQGFERRTMPSSWWTKGVTEVVLKTILRIFDLPENMATTRYRICSGIVDAPGLFSHEIDRYHTANSTGTCNGRLQLNRFELLGYYIGSFLYMYPLAAEVAGLVLGFYMYICVNVFHLHWNEAFSSIRSPDYKSFVRFHIDKSGDLHAYVIGIDKPPKKWREDSRWSSTWTRLLRSHFNNPGEDLDELDPSIASFGAKFPSRWIRQYSRSQRSRERQEPRLVDYFCIPRKRKWVQVRRGSSVINADWWESFSTLEKRKVFKKTKSRRTRRRSSHSQSPIQSQFGMQRNSTSLNDMGKKY